MADSNDNLEPLSDKPAWFARPSVDLLFYRINRRPIGGDPSLFQPEEDLLGHLERVLTPSAPGFTGKRFQRQWQLGNLVFNRDAGTFTGQLGWAKQGEALSQIWDADTHQWIDRLVPVEDSAVAPVAFTLSGRILGILKHPSFSTEAVLDQVVAQILNKGEQESGFPTTVWGVEPLGNTGEFYDWLNSVEQLLVLRMVFARPNPDAEPEFQELYDRLDRYHAGQITEEIRATNDEIGLQKEAVRSDPTTRGFLAAALLHAFGRIWAKGRRNGKEVQYDQRRRVLRQSIDIDGGDWDTATRNVLGAVERKGIDYGGETKNRGRILDDSGSSTAV